MAIVIKKKISLETLGEDYKDSYLTFQSIPFKDFEKIAEMYENISATDESKQGAESLKFIREQLEKRFIDGNVDGQDVQKNDLFDLPGEVIIDCFQQLMGKLNPN